jgi:hypothetical protein
MDIQLLDHLIIDPEDYYSFADNANHWAGYFPSQMLWYLSPCTNLSIVYWSWWIENNNTCILLGNYYLVSERITIKSK